MFKLRRVLYSQSILDPHLHLKLFDSMITPIATYGCQVWAQELVKSSHLFRHVETSPMEQVHNKMCRSILHVPKNASGIAVRGELGRYPLLLFVIKQTINFWIHISGSKNKILKDAFLTEIETDQCGTHSLASVVRVVLTELGMEKFLQNNKVDLLNCPVKQLSKQLQNKYELYFNETLRSTHGTSGKGGNKLRTYAEMKGAHKMELYLNCGLPKSYMKNIASFRLSTHKLEVEVGRYHKPKPIPAEERICRQCDTGKMENEFHLMFECDKYNSLRLLFQTEIKDAGFIGSINDHNALNNIFTSQCSKVLFSLGKYLQNCMAIRK